MKVVVVSPHRDDAAFSLTLTIGACLRSGNRVTVVNCFTRSDYAPFADHAFVHPNDERTFVSGLRHKEDEAWRRQQKNNALQLTDLNLKDAPLRLRCPLQEICTHEVDPADKAFAAIAKGLERMNGDVFFLPLALGGHIDHRTAHMASSAQIMAQPVAFYEDLPYAAWTDVTPTIETFAHRVGERFGAELRPFRAARGSSAPAEKLRAALCYDSQIDNATAQLIAGFSERYDGGERVWGTASFQACAARLGLSD